MTITEEQILEITPELQTWLKDHDINAIALDDLTMSLYNDQYYTQASALLCHLVDDNRRVADFVDDVVMTLIARFVPSVATNWEPGDTDALDSTITRIRASACRQDALRVESAWYWYYHWMDDGARNHARMVTLWGVDKDVLLKHIRLLQAAERS